MGLLANYFFSLTIAYFLPLAIGVLHPSDGTVGEFFPLVLFFSRWYMFSSLAPSPFPRFCFRPPDASPLGLSSCCNMDRISLLPNLLLRSLGFFRRSLSMFLVMQHPSDFLATHSLCTCPPSLSFYRSSHRCCLPLSYGAVLLCS